MIREGSPRGKYVGAARLLFGCAVLVCLFVVGCKGTSPTPTPAPSLTPAATATPTQVPVGEAEPTLTIGQTSIPPVSIALVSTTKEAQPGQEFKVDVTLDPQGRGISGVELKIQFDATNLRLVGLTPGKLLGEEPVEFGPVVIGEADNLIHYAAARIGETLPPTPSGLVAAMKFQVLETAAAGGETSLKITEVKVPDENIRVIHDISVGEGITVEIPP